MTIRRCTVVFETEEPTINRLPVIEEDIVFFRKYQYTTTVKNNNRRRSITYQALMDPSDHLDPSDLHEATPLLLQSRLINLITAPKDTYKRVGKVIGKIGNLPFRSVLLYQNISTLSLQK